MSVIDLLDAVSLPFVLKALAPGFPRCFGTIHLAEAHSFIEEHPSESPDIPTYMNSVIASAFAALS